MLSEPYNSFTNNVPNFASPFRMLRILTNALANVTNACERLMNENITERVLANIFVSSLIRQNLPSKHLVV